MPKQYLTVNEVAKILGVSPLTVRNWDQKGRLIAHRNPINNYRLYRISDVEKLMKDIDSSRGQTFRQAQGLRVPEPEKPKFKKLNIELE